MKKRDKMQTQQQASNHEKLASVIDHLINREHMSLSLSLTDIGNFSIKEYGRKFN